MQLDEFIYTNTDLLKGWSIGAQLGMSGSRVLCQLVKTDASGRSYYSLLKAVYLDTDDRDQSDSEALDKLLSVFHAVDDMRDCPQILPFEDMTINAAGSDNTGYVIYIFSDYLPCVGTLLAEEEYDASEAEIIRMGLDILSALKTMHSDNIIHGAISPDSIFMTKGGVYRLGSCEDAALNRMLPSASRNTGSVNYASPEEARGEPLDERSDLYSLGLTLYRLLDGRFPFLDAGSSYSDFGRAISRRLEGEPLPVPANASDALAQVILNACAFSPSDRYQSAEDMRNDLLELADSCSAFNLISNRFDPSKIARKRLSVLALLMCVVCALLMISPLAVGLSGLVSANSSGASNACPDYETGMLDGKLWLRSCTVDANTITVPATINGRKVDILGDSLFENNTGLVEVVIPEGITGVYTSAFENCTSLKRVSLPESLTELGLRVFYRCSSLSDMVIPSRIKSIPLGTFAFCTALKSVEIPSGVQHLGQNAFTGCSSLENVALPADLQYIGDCAFLCCSKLSSFNIPANVSHIGEQALSGLSGVEKFTVSQDNVFYTAVNGVLYSRDNTILVCFPGGRTGEYLIPEGTLAISGGAFKYSVLEQITIPSTVQLIAAEAFSGMTSTDLIAVDDENPYYISMDGALYNRDMTTLICVPAGMTGSFTVPSSVSAIETGAFRSTQLSEVTIPQNVVSIGDNAFVNRCEHLVIYGASGSEAERIAADEGIAFLAA